MRRLPAPAWLFAVAVGASALASGCATAPDRPTVSSVRIEGAREISAAEAKEKLATRESSTFLGIHLSYETYDAFVVARDVTRLERFYRARGFHAARVVSAHVVGLPGKTVDVEFVIDEGPPTVIREDPKLIGLEGLDRRAGVAVSRAMPFHACKEPTPAGECDPFDEDEYEAAKRKMQRALTDNGYAHATIEGGFTEADLAPDGGHELVLDPIRDIARIQALESERAAGGPKPPDGAATPTTPRKFGVRVDVVRHTAEVFLRVNHGPPCVFGDVKIEGLGDLPEGQVRAALGVRAGESYSTETLESGRKALVELGVFSSVEFVAHLPEDDGPVIPVTFKVTRAPLNTITLGGGAFADTISNDLHFLAGYEHRNFLGGLRRASLQVRPGVVLFPTNLQNGLAPTNALFQARARAELRQPQLFEARTRGTLRNEIAVYPLLLPARTAAEVPEVVVGYYEIRPSAGLERSFFDGKVALSAFYNLQLSYPISYLGPYDDSLQRVIVSHVSFTQALDLRDNPVKPRKGVYVANEVQFAGGFLGGDADDVRVQPDVRFYTPVSTRITAAMRGSVGFLFPRSYGSTLSRDAPDPTVDPAGAFTFSRQRDRDLQLLYFRAFFSGGPNSNRGYAIRGVGPRGLAPYTLGGQRSVRECSERVRGGTGVGGGVSQVAALPPVSPATLEALCYVPLGGLSLWEWSTELRIQLTDKLSTLVFLDASDVTRERFTVRLNFPHLSTGTGLRYDTPVGPVRLDIGYAIPGAQQLGATLDSKKEGQPTTVFGAPIAVNIAVGEAF